MKAAQVLMKQEVLNSYPMQYGGSGRLSSSSGRTGKDSAASQNRMIINRINKVMQNLSRI